MSNDPDAETTAEQVTAENLFGDQGSEHPYDALSPDAVLDAVESLGFYTDGRVLTLNSYENRVYQVGTEDDDPLIAKFYRPNRWSREQLLEEHAFAMELVEQDLPVVPPLELDGDTLHHYGDFYFAVYDRKGGRAPELDDDDNLAILSRSLGRMHQVGRARPFVHRPELSVDTFGHDSVDYLLDHYIPTDLAAEYDAVTCDILNRIDDLIDIKPPELIRVHGDCHIGNILWRNGTPNFVDLDDSRMAPAVQDIWMLLSGSRVRQQEQLQIVLPNYRQFAEFDGAELRLVEAYRTLRIMHYSAWLGRRWGDPAFPPAFPWFNQPNYWRQHIGDLHDQLEALQAA